MRLKQHLIHGLFLFCLLSAKANADAVLRFSWWGAPDRQIATEKAIRLFEARFPNVKIQAEPGSFTGYQEKLADQLAKHTEPDIMQIDWAWMSFFSPKGNDFLDLNTFKQSVLKLDEFTNQSYRFGLVYGKLNGLPTSYSSRVFIWNKRVFDRAGIDLPETWDDLLKAGQVFRQKLGPDYYPLDGNPFTSLHLSHAYIMQKTGKPYILPHQPGIGLSVSEAEEWVRFFRSLYSNHVVVPLAVHMAHGDLFKGLHDQQAWPQGKWAGSYNWTSTLRSHADTLGSNGKLVVGKFPLLPGAKTNGKFARPAQMLAVKRDCPYPDVAARFINFMLTDPDAIRILGTTRGIPLTRTGIETLSKENMIEPFEKIAQEQINSSYNEFPSPLFESQAIRDLQLQVFEQVASGKLSDKQAAEILVRDGARILEQINPSSRPEAKQSAAPR